MVLRFSAVVTHLITLTLVKLLAKVLNLHLSATDMLLFSVVDNIVKHSEVMNPSNWVFNTLDKEVMLADVLPVVGKYALCFVSVSACSSDLLDVGVQRLRNVCVDHIPDVWLVDSQGKGNGGHDDSEFVLHPAFLHVLSNLGVKTCVIALGLDTHLLKFGGELLSLVPFEAVNDSCLILVFLNVVNKVEILKDYDVEVGSVEGVHEGDTLHVELPYDILSCLLSSCCCKSQDLHIWEHLFESL